MVKNTLFFKRLAKRFNLFVLALKLLNISIKINKLALLGIVFVISGGIGNFIDRIFRGYVIDFIDFGQLVNFPIFNFADICVVLGVIIVGISYFIMNRGESFENNNCKR